MPHIKNAYTHENLYTYMFDYLEILSLSEYAFTLIIRMRWDVVIGAEGILRCSTKSLLLLTINESTIHTIHTYDQPSRVYDRVSRLVFASL